MGNFAKVSANENIHLVSGNHTDITAGQSLTAHAAESLNLFAQSSGIKVQANQGKVEVQAQNDELQLNALKDAVLTSSSGRVNIAAQEEVLITCKGAYIKFSNGEIEIGSPKLVRVKAPLEVTGANGIQYKISDFKQNYSGGYIIYNEKTGLPIANLPYELTTENNEKLKGITDMEGKTIMAFTDKPEKVKIDIQQQKHSSERKRTLYFAGVKSMDLYLEWTEKEGDH